MAEATANPSTVSTRERILHAAGQCFEQLSIRQTTMEEVARVSGLSRQTVYRHFPGKEELVAAVSEIKSRQITEIVRRCVAAVADSRGRIAAAILACVECLVTDRQMREMIESDYKALMVRSARPEIVAAVTERWTPILAAAIDDGTLPADAEPDKIISWLTDIQLLLAMRIIALGKTPEDVRHEVESFVLNGICQQY